MRYIVLATAIWVTVFAINAFAEIVEFQHPTERVDGSVLPIEEIQTFRIYTEDVATGEITIQEIDKTLAEATIILEPKSWSIWMTTLDTDGRESAKSNLVQVIYPKAPVIIIVR